MSAQAPMSMAKRILSVALHPTLAETREAVRQMELRALAELADALRAQGGRQGEA